jgi:hypothetical protein
MNGPEKKALHELAKKEKYIRFGKKETKAGQFNKNDKWHLFYLIYILW